MDSQERDEQRRRREMHAFRQSLERRRERDEQRRRREMDAFRQALERRRERDEQRRRREMHAFKQALEHRREMHAFRQALEHRRERDEQRRRREMHATMHLVSNASINRHSSNLSINYQENMRNTNRIEDINYNNAMESAHHSPAPSYDMASIETELVKLIQLDPEMENYDFDKSFICPISTSLMLDPVIVVGSGITYDRKEIEKWFISSNKDPVTKLVVDKTLVPNHLVRGQILSCVEKLKAEKETSKRKVESEVKTHAENEEQTGQIPWHQKMTPS